MPSTQVGKPHEGAANLARIFGHSYDITLRAHDSPSYSQGKRGGQAHTPDPGRSHESAATVKFTKAGNSFDREPLRSMTPRHARGTAEAVTLTSVHSPPPFRCRPLRA